MNESLVKFNEKAWFGLFTSRAKRDILTMGLLEGADRYNSHGMCLRPFLVQ